MDFRANYQDAGVAVRLNCKDCGVKYGDGNYFPSKTRKDGMATYCRKCVSKRTMRSHNKNREATRALVADHLARNPCAVCGETDIRVLDFDHTDRSSKFLCVAEWLAQGGITAVSGVKREIARCRVLCANCHRRHTAEQLNTWRYKLYTEREKEKGFQTS